jgi:HSP20 family protein
MREMAAMQNMMDRFFEDWRPFFDEGRTLSMNNLAIDLDEEDNQYIVTTELPGVRADDINVRQEGDFLVIEAETRDESEQQGNGNRRTLVKERRYGRYSRRLRLPQTVDFDKAEATYQDGILTLRLPKSEETQPRTIPVRTATSNGNQS